MILPKMTTISKKEKYRDTTSQSNLRIEAI
jgi:hypothetical protein